MADKVRYRTIDIVTPVMIAVAFGVIFIGLGALFNALSPLWLLYKPTEGLFMGLWLLSGVVAGLIVRKPGAALLAELLAAAIEMLLGGQWAAMTLVSGVLQGLGMEISLAVWRYRRGGMRVSVVGGMIGALFESVFERLSYYPMFRPTDTVFYMIFCLISGALLAGVLGQLIVKALAGAGALNSFPVGRERARLQASDAK